MRYHPTNYNFTDVPQPGKYVKIANLLADKKKTTAQNDADMIAKAEGMDPAHFYGVLVLSEYQRKLIQIKK